MKKERIIALLTDIRFWIFLFFVLRLIGINHPPLEIGHNWRQSLTCMIARNFYEGNANLLYPQVDMAGNHTGIIGSEFPFFNYVIYLVSLLFGYAHWYGRLINLVVSSFGIYFFYLLIAKILDRRIAFNAAIVLLTSIWFAYSRKIMPDTFSVSLVIIGLYYGYRFLFSAKKISLILFFIFITLGMLCKIPALSLVSAIAVLFITDKITLKRKLMVIISAAISVSIVGLWYFIWVPYLVSTFHFQLYFPKGFFEGMAEIWPLMGGFFEKFYIDSLKSYIAFAFVITGLFFIIRNTNRYIKSGLLVITITFIVFIIKTGSVFPTHSYYIVPYTPVMALIAGYGINKLGNRFMYLVLLLIAIEGIAGQQHDFFIKDSERYKLSLENLVNRNIDKKELIVINGGGSPQELYFAHRKGWSLNNEMINKPKIDTLKNLGASYLIINKKSLTSPVGYYPVICSDGNYDIYSLK